MRQVSHRIIVGAVAASMALGAGAAVAATGDQPTCPYGNVPQAGQADRPSTTGSQQRLRERDGTGPRHAQRSQRSAKRGGDRLQARDGTGPHHAAIVAQRTS